MKRSDLATRILAVAGTVLIALPLIAPLVLTAVFAAQTGAFRLDWLIPAELGLFALAGAILLLIAAFRAESRKGLIGWGFATAVGAIVAVSVLAQVTGLASGDTAPEGWPFLLVTGVYVAYVLALVELTVAGVLLSIDLFGNHREPAPPAVPAA